MGAIATAPARPRRVPAAIAPIDRALGTLAEIPLELIDVGANVRVDAGELEELAASIRERGVLQPIRVVGPNLEGRYQAVWGQRRVKASILAGRSTIPALVEPTAAVDPDGARRSIEQLVENIQRADLGPLDEAYALKRVLDADHMLTQVDLARSLGRSPSWLANTLGLLDAPPEIQADVAAGRLTASHAKALKGLAPKTQLELAGLAVERGWSAHAIEDQVRYTKEREATRQENEKTSRINAAAQREARTKKVQALVKKIPLDTPIHIASYGHSESAEAIGKIFTTVGYTNLTIGNSPGVTHPRPKDVGCNCTDWVAQIGWDGGFSMIAACREEKHRAARTKADDEARRAKTQLVNDGRDRLRLLLPSIVVDQPMAVLPMRIALFTALSWKLDDWTKAHGGSAKDPWAAICSLDDRQLAAELGAALPEAFGSRYGDGSDLAWQGLLEQLAEVEFTACPFPKCVLADEHRGEHATVTPEKV